MPPSTDFRGRRAVVTGAASGIGRATALLLLERGATVVGADLDERGLEQVRAAGAEAVACDLASAAGRARLAEAAGRCDHLVNAAGVIRLVPPERATEEDWDAILDVNAKALFFLCRDFGPLLADGGAIVNLSSVAARDARTLEAAIYAASKAAVVSITRSFAYAYAPRVRVNAVLPGIVDTPMQEQVLDEVAAAQGTTPEALHAARLARVPLGRSAPPEECAEAILALLGPAGAYVTGQALAVDGGYTMA